MLDTPLNIMPTVAAVFALVLGAIPVLFRIGWRWGVVVGLALVLSAACAVGISPPVNLPGLLSARIADAVDFSLSTPGLALLAASVAIALRRSDKPVRWDLVFGLLAVLLTVYAVWSSAPNLGGLSTIFSANPWLFATLLILLLFRQTVREVVAALAKRLEAGSVDLNIGQVVKIKIEEPSITDAAPSALPFSRSPFEIESESVVDESSRIRFDLLPQILLPITDIVADLWSNEPENQGHRDTLDKARDALKTSRQSSVRTSLDTFVAALRDCRFLKCNDLLRLREASRELKAILTEIETKKPVSQLNDGDRLILHCLGIANALDEEWVAADALLAPLVDDLKYLPAADTYLACKFNAYIKEKTSEDTDLDAKEFLAWFLDTWVAEAERLLDDCDKANWTKLFPLNNKGFHMRELYKVLGGIYSIVAENFSNQEYYAAADKCTQQIENQNALDHNNLADLYRKMGRYEDARHEIDQAFRLSGDASRPIFYYTRAEILRAQGRLWEGVEALNVYTEARARKDDEIRWYIRNQIFAAKLVAEDSSFGRWKLALSIDILERAKAFLEREKARVQADQRRSLECELNELIGIAYLELPHCEEKSISALEDSLRVCADDRSEAQRKRTVRLEAQWKRTVALARAHVRHARSLRQRTSIRDAERHRLEAERRLEDSESKLSAFPVDDVSPGRAARRFRLHFDAFIANQELAGELFQQGALEAAKARLDGTVEKLWRELGGFLKKDQAREALAGDLAEMRAQLARYRAYRDFLLGRISARLTPDLVTEVRAAFDRSRNVEGMLTPWVDVELGTFLLSAAEKNKDMTIYDEAIACLESAASADQLAPRREAVRVLTLAYARRPQLRKQK